MGERADGMTVRDWARVIDALEERGLVETRATDHEYRSDDRDIVSIGGKKLRWPKSVDGLPYNDDPECAVLLKLYHGL